jgi:hypothetical protein
MLKPQHCLRIKVDGLAAAQITRALKTTGATRLGFAHEQVYAFEDPTERDRVLVEIRHRYGSTSVDQADIA